MSEIHFVGKTRYEDLTETGSKIDLQLIKETSVEFCLKQLGNLFAIDRQGHKASQLEDF